MREFRAVSFPVAWVLGGAAAGLATFDLWLGLAAAVPAAGIIAVPEALDHRQRTRRLQAMGITGRLPAGLSAGEALAPATALFVAILCGVAAAAIATTPVTGSFTAAGHVVLLGFVTALGGASLAVMSVVLVAQRRGLERLAKGRGWLLVREDRDLPGLLSGVEPVRLGHPPHESGRAAATGVDLAQHTCTKVLYGRVGKVPFRTFEYQYSQWSPHPRSKHRRVRTDRTHHVLAATVPAHGPDLLVRALDARLASRDGPPDVPIAQGMFAATFSVQANDAEFVYDWLNQGVVDVLMAFGPAYTLNWNGETLTLYGPGPLGPVEAMMFYGGLQQMLRMMPFADNPPRSFSIPGKPGSPPRRAFEPTGPVFNITRGPRQDV